MDAASPIDSHGAGQTTDSSGDDFSNSMAFTFKLADERVPAAWRAATDLGDGPDSGRPPATGDGRYRC